MKYTLSPHPDLAYKIADSRNHNSLLLILGECQVKFNGRAKSFLDYGERLVIVKKDGAVLVHRSKGCDAINWQPPGTKTSIILDNKQLVLSSYRNNPPEQMQIRFRDIMMVIHSALKDKVSLKLTGMESDYVEMVKKDPSVIEDGLRIIGKERRTNSGAIDLYGMDKNNIPVIIELKRGTAGISAVYQLESYVNDLKKKNQNVKVRGILCAPRASSMVHNLLVERGLEYKSYRCRFLLKNENQRTLMDF